MKTLDANGRCNRAGIFKKLWKLNFYSTFCYYFDKSQSYILQLTSAALLNNFLDHRIFCNEDKFISKVNKYKEVRNVAKNDIAEGKCVFRAEFRCKLRDAEGELEKLKRTIKIGDFGYYRSSDFFKILQKNIDCLLHLIVNGNREGGVATPESMVYGLIAEYILKVLFLGGSEPCSVLPKNLNDLITENIPRISQDHPMILLQ